MATEEKILFLDNYNGSEYHRLRDYMTGFDPTTEGNWQRENAYLIDMNNKENFILTNIKTYLYENGTVPSRDVTINIFEVTGTLESMQITKLITTKAFTLTAHETEAQVIFDMTEKKITLFKDKKYIVGLTTGYNLTGFTYNGYDINNFFPGEDEGLNDREISKTLNAGIFKEYYQGDNSNSDIKLVVGNTIDLSSNIPYATNKVIAAKIQLFGYRWNYAYADYTRIISLAGKGASTDIKDVPSVASFVENGMAQIITWTKYDWITNWNNITTRGQEIIKSAIEYLAAINLVNYDTTGYTSRFEAQYISNYLQFQADRLIGLLASDQGLIGFMKTGE